MPTVHHFRPKLHAFVIIPPKNLRQFDVPTAPCHDFSQPRGLDEASGIPCSGYHTAKCSLCPRPLPRSCNNSTASTDPRRSFRINFATCFTGWIIGDACMIFKAMTWCGSPIIWIRCVATSRFPTLRRLSCFRLSMISTLPAPLSESACVNLKPYAATGGYFPHRTPFRFTFSTSVPNRLPPGVTMTCTRGTTMVQWFASNGCARTLARIRRRQVECVTGAIAFTVHYH